MVFIIKLCTRKRKKKLSINSLSHSWPVQHKKRLFLENLFSPKSHGEVQHGICLEGWACSFTTSSSSCKRLIPKKSSPPLVAHTCALLCANSSSCAARCCAAVQLMKPFPKDRIIKNIKRQLCIRKGPVPSDSAVWHRVTDFKDKAWRKRRREQRRLGGC